MRSGAIREQTASPRTPALGTETLEFSCVVAPGRVHTRLQSHTHKRTNTHKDIYTHTSTHRSLHLHTLTQTHAHNTHPFYTVFLLSCMDAPVCAQCTHTQTYTHTHTHTYTHTHLHTSTQTHTHTYIHLSKPRHTHTHNLLHRFSVFSLFLSEDR